MPSLIGREAMPAYLEGTRTIAGFRINWSSTDAHVSPDGTMAHLLSTDEVAMDGPDGQPVKSRGRAVTGWNRTDQGQWCSGHLETTHRSSDSTSDASATSTRRSRLGLKQCLVEEAHDPLLVLLGMTGQAADVPDVVDLPDG